MIIKDTESIDVQTSTGPMRTYLFRQWLRGAVSGLAVEKRLLYWNKGQSDTSTEANQTTR